MSIKSRGKKAVIAEAKRSDTLLGIRLADQMKFLARYGSLLPGMVEGFKQSDFFNRIFTTEGGNKIYCSALKFRDHFYLGYAYCSPDDQFNRRRGREIAQGRAWHVLTTVFDYAAKAMCHGAADYAGALKMIANYGIQVSNPSIVRFVIPADEQGHISIDTLLAHVDNRISFVGHVSTIISKKTIKELYPESTLVAGPVRTAHNALAKYGISSEEAKEDDNSRIVCGGYATKELHAYMAEHGINEDNEDNDQPSHSKFNREYYAATNADGEPVCGYPGDALAPEV